MASGMHVIASKEFVVIGSKGTVKSFSLSNGAHKLTYLHQFDETTTNGNSKPLEEKLEDMSLADNEEYFCLLYSDKKLIVISTLTWSVLGTVTTNRRPTAVSFQPDNQHILVADKAGDVYRYEISRIGDGKAVYETLDDKDDVTVPILGHVSMLLDVRADEKYVYTADRDEKIRISVLEHPYCIESYCLGHTEFVSKIQPLRISGKSLLLSLSGDSTVRLWNVETGQEISKLLVPSQVLCTSGTDLKQKLIPSVVSVSKDGDIVLVSSNQTAFPYVLLYELDSQSETLTLQAHFKLKDCERICDAKFSQSSNNIYVLSVASGSDILNLQVFSHDNGAWQCIEGGTVDIIASQLKNFPIDESEDLSTLYKLRGDGEVYDSYFKRKADRISGVKYRKTNEDNLSKRLKAIG